MSDQKTLRVTHIDNGVHLENKDEVRKNRGSWAKVSFNNGVTLNLHYSAGSGQICFTGREHKAQVFCDVLYAWTVFNHLLSRGKIKDSNWRKQVQRTPKSREYWEQQLGLNK